MSDGVFFNPNVGDIIATGNLSAAQTHVPSEYDSWYGNKTLPEIISSYSPPTDLTEYYKKSETSSSNEISIAIKNIDVSQQLSGYVKLKSGIKQTIDSDVGITKSLTVGTLSIVSDSSRFSYKILSNESVNMQDRAINKLTMNDNLYIWLPPEKPGVARDFLLNLDYVSGQMTIGDEIAKCGDELSFTAGKQHLIAFTEIGKKNGLAQFYIRSIELT